ncbi:MAG: molybdenum cofactor guanylyltransferase, partial [Candidatus Desulfofervidaceae bacterium]|nr:molybdenum cofactor guanylyltransferase [Candidatus Desulfofervidaceae bacterium]
RFVTDLIPYQGPLGGIFTGLFYTTHFPALVLACDLPFITQDVLKCLLSHWEEGLDALVPLTPDGHQPLCALYDYKAMQVFQRCLEKGDLRLYQALKYLKKKYLPPQIMQTVDPQGKAFLNLNRPEDIEQAQKLC